MVSKEDIENQTTKRPTHFLNLPTLQWEPIWTPSPPIKINGCGCDDEQEDEYQLTERGITGTGSVLDSQSRIYLDKRALGQESKPQENKSHNTHVFLMYL